MLFNWTAEHDDDGTEFGGVVEGDLIDDLRPVFALARERAVEHYPDHNVTVTEINYVSD